MANAWDILFIIFVSKLLFLQPSAPSQELQVRNGLGAYCTGPERWPPLARKRGLGKASAAVST